MIKKTQSPRGEKVPDRNMAKNGHPIIMWRKRFGPQYGQKRKSNHAGEVVDAMRDFNEILGKSIGKPILLKYSESAPRSAGSSSNSAIGGIRPLWGKPVRQRRNDRKFSRNE